MTRLKKESEKRAKALRKERKARALERRNARKMARDDDAASSESRDISRAEKEKEEEETQEDDDGEFDPLEGLLLVYICTHTAEITKGKGVAGTYLVTSHTSWVSKEQLAKTAIPLETFAEAIGRIQVR